MLTGRTHRHFLPMPFTPPCFAPEFFFDAEVLCVVRSALGDRVVADQWGCDVPLQGSEYQGVHADYQRPLFEETPDLSLPPYMLVVSFGLVPITLANGPIEIAPGTHRLSRADARRAVDAGEIALRPVPLEIGDVLIRHPWALHRGTPNTTETPRALCTIRYVRRWYADASREVESIPRAVWETLTFEERSMVRHNLIQVGRTTGIPTRPTKRASTTPRQVRDVSRPARDVASVIRAGRRIRHRHRARSPDHDLAFRRQGRWRGHGVVLGRLR